MMNKQVYIWLIISALVMVFAGCNGVPDYDQRLVEAEKIVSKQADKAKSILQEINPNELDEANAAYYNLLLTQACYINYDIITSENDSIINRALDYFKKHKGDKEKYIRSIIYKGAVTEVLGLSDSLSMDYYKTAELYSDKKDYFNRGYAQLRMGSLYKKYKAFDGSEIKKYAQADSSFRSINNDYYLMLTLRDLGALYRYRNPVKAEEMLNEAIALAQKEKDTKNYIHCASNLAYLYFMQSAKVEKDSAAKVLNKANRLLQSILKIKQLDSIGLTDNEYATFACVYANIGKVDSASLFLESAEQQHQQDPSYFKSNNYLVPKSQIAKARGNMYEYYKFSH